MVKTRIEIRSYVIDADSIQIEKLLELTDKLKEVDPSICVYNKEGELEAFYYNEANISGIYKDGELPVRSRDPEECHPGTPGEIDNFTLEIKGLDITDYLTQEYIEDCHGNLIEEYEGG